MKHPADYELAPGVRNIVSYITQQLAIGVAKKQDWIISAAITERLGQSNWKLEDLVGRLYRVQAAGEPYETYVLDNQPLVQIWPPQLTDFQDGHSQHIEASVQYRTFPNHGIHTQGN